MASSGFDRRDEGPETDHTAAQRLRLRRVLWGTTAYGWVALIAVACVFAGFLSGRRVVHFGVAAVLLNVFFVTMIASGLNLKFREPSLTAAQILAPILPTIYLMYHVEEPLARLPFLFMATVMLLFGTLALDTGRMLLISGTYLVSYLLLVAILQQTAPERIDPAAERVIIFAYAAMLLQVSFLGSYIAGLRNSLRLRNRALREALVEVRKMAARDDLTHLPNRRALMEHLEREQSRLRRRRSDQASLCVCLIDIDHFKQVNDTHGHQAGDAVLQAVAEELETSLRKGDFAGRFGGEEFLVILPESSPEGALRAAERIRSMIALVEVPGVDLEGGLRASIGVATYRSQETVDTVLARADAALYRAKEQGRDRVVVDDTLDEPRS